MSRHIYTCTPTHTYTRAHERSHTHSLSLSLSLSLSHTYTCTSIYIYIYIEREREGESEREFIGLQLEKKIRFLLSDKAVFRMIDYLSIVVHVFASRILMSFSVHETLLTRELNASSSFRETKSCVELSPC